MWYVKIKRDKSNCITVLFYDKFQTYFYLTDKNYLLVLLLVPVAAGVFFIYKFFKTQTHPGISPIWLKVHVLLWLCSFGPLLRLCFIIFLSWDHGSWDREVSILGVKGNLFLFLIYFYSHLERYLLYRISATLSFVERFTILHWCYTIPCCPDCVWLLFPYCFWNLSASFQRTESNKDGVMLLGVKSGGEENGMCTILHDL